MGPASGAHLVNRGEGDIEIGVAVAFGYRSAECQYDQFPCVVQGDVASWAVIAVECIDHCRVVSCYERAGAVVTGQALARVVDVLVAG